MLATPVASPRTQWLLLFAAFWMLAQSALLPLVTPSMNVWTPMHRHITLDSVVPSHVHGYDHPADEAPRTTACFVTDSSSTATETQHRETIVCAPDNDGATSAAAVSVQHVPAVLQVALAGVESLALLSVRESWQSLVVSIPTPPPRF